MDDRFDMNTLISQAMLIVNALGPLMGLSVGISLGIYVFQKMTRFIRADIGGYDDTPAPRTESPAPIVQPESPKPIFRPVIKPDPNRCAYCNRALTKHQTECPSCGAPR